MASPRKNKLLRSKSMGEYFLNITVYEGRIFGENYDFFDENGF